VIARRESGMNKAELVTEYKDDGEVIFNTEGCEFDWISEPEYDADDLRGSEDDNKHLEEVD